MDADVSHIIQSIVITFPAFLLALVVHEYSHAWMATRFGDQTAAWSGRLTLNPLVHIDWIGTILLPLIGIVFGGFMFGWAKPVPIDPRQFKSYRSGLFWVSFAGPLSNLILGFGSMLFLYGLARFNVPLFGFDEPVVLFLKALTMVNFMLAVFNLLPFPPMDGSNILLSFLSYNATRIFYQIQSYTYMAVMLLMFTGAFRIVSVPVVLLYDFSQSLARHVFGLA
jgi:Zn-dependent protease